MAEGIDPRHQRACRSRDGQRCNCTPTYQAHVFDKRTKKRLRKSFPTAAAAKTWRQDALRGLRMGTLATGPAITVRQAAADWIAGARNGTIRNRSGDPYKPSAVKAYEQSLRLRVLDVLGDKKLADVRRVDIQDLIDGLVAEKYAASTVQCAILPLRGIYRRAVSRGELEVNPTSGVQVPAIRGGRDRIADPVEAAALLAALDDADRALWATAMYAGLRRGELMALRWEFVDFERGTIRVEKSWDLDVGEVEPKSKAGKRTVPIATVLREHLIAHRLRSGRHEGYVFAREDGRPFAPQVSTERADAAWETAGLNRLTLHDCRHTAASLMIAAGINAKALCSFMGHESITTTYNKYGHLMPGSENEAASLLDVYLSAATTKAG